MSRVLPVALVCGLALSLGACSTVRNLWPWGKDEPQAVASEGERVSIIEFEQGLTPSTALAGVDFLLPQPQPVLAWPLPGGTPEQSVEHVQAAPDFQIAWRRNIGKGSSRTSQVMSPVIAAQGRIYVMDGQARVSAVDAASGNILWQTNLSEQRPDRDAFGGGLAFADGRVYATSGYRLIAALDAATGAIAWTQPTDVPVHGAPAVAGGRVFAIDIDNQLMVLDAATGDLAWSYQAISEPARVMRASSPAIVGDTVIAPFSSGELMAFRATNGQGLWEATLARATRTSALSEIRDIAGRPVVSRGVVYATTHSGQVAALDVRSGGPVWENPPPVGGVNAPLPVGDVVYLISNSGELVVINRANGGVYWTKSLNEGRIRQEGGFLGIMDRTVRPTWSGPILASNRLVMVNSDGEALGLNPKTGEQVAWLDLGGPAMIAPIAYNGMLYVLTDEGDLVSIR